MDRRHYDRSGLVFSLYEAEESSDFNRVFEIFKELITHTSGDLDEALDWLTELDKEYKIFNAEYSYEDFIEDLKNRGFIREEFEDPEQTNGEGEDGDESGNPGYSLTAKLEQTLRKQMSTVLMIDISHSMILYGEDRITPAKKVAMALVELIQTKYPKDSIDVIVFGNDAWPIAIKDLPYLKVGPYHTNTVAGLELAMDILRRKRNTNRQIFMITDGKPSCIQLPSGEPNGEYYKNSNGLDEHIVHKCYNMAAQARKLKIPITTFMIAKDPYLQQFIDEFTAQNRGKAFYTGLQGLGEMIFEDYERNRIKRI